MSKIEVSNAEFFKNWNFFVTFVVNTRDGYHVAFYSIKQHITLQHTLSCI